MNFQEYLTWFRDVVDKEVEGWFYPIDIIVMYGILNDMQRNISGDICEIGVAYGKSAIAISNFKKSEDKLYLYDIFPQEVYDKCLENINKFGIPDNLVWRIEDTTNLEHSQNLFDRRLRFLHIDGCHEHSAVLSDLQFFSHYMVDQGIIVLDDFNDYEYPGVNSAAIEFSLAKYNNKNWRVFAIGDNKAYMCQKRYVNTYQTLLTMFMKNALQTMNVPFPLPLALREMLDVNVLMCDSREDWEYKKIMENINDKPRIG
jgi:hypothetical protein